LNQKIIIKILYWKQNSYEWSNVILFYFYILWLTVVWPYTLLPYVKNIFSLFFFLLINLFILYKIIWLIKIKYQVYSVFMYKTIGANYSSSSFFALHEIHDCFSAQGFLI